MVGNMLYYAADYVKNYINMWLAVCFLVLGQVLIGFGSSPLIAKNYFERHAPVDSQLVVLGALVALNALGLCLGPALSAALELSLPYVPLAILNKPFFQPWNIFALAMTLLWGLFFLLLSTLFRKQSKFDSSKLVIVADPKALPPLILADIAAFLYQYRDLR